MCHNCGRDATGIPWGKVRNIAKHSTVHRTAVQEQRITWFKICVVIRLSHFSLEQQEGGRERKSNKVE